MATRKEAHYESRQPLLEDSDEFLSYDEENIGLETYRRKKQKRFQLSCVVATCILILMVVAVALFLWADKINSSSPSIPTPEEARDFPVSHSVMGKYKSAAISSDSTICSDIGKNILLEKKGSAVDAAIAVCLCYGVVNPLSSGIGGGHFMTIYDSSTKTSVIINARETAPLNASEDMYNGNPDTAARGALSIAVPGEIWGLWLAHQKFHNVSWQEVFQPSINLAADGFPVSKHLASALQTSKSKIEGDEDMRKAYTNPETGEFYVENEMIKLPQLAKTLSTIAKEGASAFYNGSLAKEIIKDLEEKGSIITEEDLLNYMANTSMGEGITTKLRDGSTLYAPSAPSGGPVLAFILNILDGFQMTPESLKTREERLVAYHRIIEAFKFAYAKRTDLGDPEFISISDLIANLTSPSFADGIRSKIWDNTTHGTMYYGPTFYDKLTTSTAHLCVVGNDGIAVSMTTTVNSRFGAGVMGKRTGIVFNNEMDDFSSPNITNSYGIRPSPANFIRPGKRPLSSMCPAVIVDKNNQIKVVAGAAGGSRITTSTAYVISRTLWFGDTIKEAVDARRLHHQLLPPVVYYEPEFPEFYLEGFQDLGHNITFTNLGQSIVNGIVHSDGWYYANDDFRRPNGGPAGF